jgi:hypothetical protein
MVYHFELLAALIDIDAQAKERLKMAPALIDIDAQVNQH